MVLPILDVFSLDSSYFAPSLEMFYAFFEGSKLNKNVLVAGILISIAISGNADK